MQGITVLLPNANRASFRLLVGAPADLVNQGKNHDHFESFMQRFYGCALVVLAFVSIFSAPSRAQSAVKISGTQGNWQLTLNGQPYYIKGLDYGPDLKTTQSTTNAYVADLVATGANTTRTWGTGSTTANLLKAVDLYNAQVVMGFWLNQNVNYCTATNLNTTLNQIVNSVNNYKNDPGVLIWDIGNEVILQAQNYFSGTTLQNDRVCYAQFVNQISQAIHSADPNHPTTSTDAWTGAWPYYAQYSPDLDLLAVNSYGGICTVQSAWASGPNNNGVPYTKPYIVTEFGPSGEWEVLQRGSFGTHGPAKGRGLSQCVGLYHRFQWQRRCGRVSRRDRFYLRQ